MCANLFYFVDVFSSLFKDPVEDCSNCSFSLSRSSFCDVILSCVTSLVALVTSCLTTPWVSTPFSVSVCFNAFFVSSSGVIVLISIERWSSNGNISSSAFFS